MSGQLPDQFQIRPPDLLAIHHVHQNERFGNELIILHEMPVLRLLVIHYPQFQRSILQLICKTLFNRLMRVLLDLYARAASRVGVKIIGYDFVFDVLRR